MPNPAVLMAAAASGRFIPDKPVLSHTALGQFTITNYDATLTYTLSTGTRVGAVITLSSINQACTVTARSPKGATESTAGTCERKAYTFNFAVDGGSYYHNSPAHGYAGNFGAGPDGSATYFCQVVGGDPNGCYHQTGTNQKAGLPSGYTDQYGEWFKVA